MVWENASTQSHFSGLTWAYVAIFGLFKRMILIKWIDTSLARIYVVKFVIYKKKTLLSFCTAGDPSPNEVPRHQLLKLYYRACFRIIELVSKAVLIIFGIFTSSINICPIIELLKNHVCVCHICLVPLVVCLQDRRWKRR